jgi:hypothetical protein
VPVGDVVSLRKYRDTVEYRLALKRAGHGDVAQVRDLFDELEVRAGAAGAPGRSSYQMRRGDERVLRNDQARRVPASKSG